MIDTVALRSRILELAFQGKLFTTVESGDRVEELIKQFPKPSNKRASLLKQGSDIVFPYRLPNNWVSVPLGKITSYGDTPQKIMTSEVSDNLWLLELEDIEAGGKLLRKTRVKEKTSVGEKIRFYKGQVLYSKLRPY